MAKHIKRKLAFSTEHFSACKMGKRKTRIGVKCQKGLFRFINWRPLNDHDGAQWKVGRSPKCNRECNILKKPLPSKVRTFYRMRCYHCHHFFGISLQLITFWSLRIHDNVAGGREEEEVQLSLTVSCGRKYLSFFQDFLVRNLEILMLICYQCRSSFLKTLGNYVISKPTHPTL